MKTTNAKVTNRSNTKKASGTRKSSQSTRNTGKASAASKRPSASAKSKTVQKKGTARSVEEMNEYQDHLAFEQGMTMLVMGVVAIICYLSYLGFAGGIGTIIGGLLFGLLGWVAWLLPAGSMIAVAGMMANQHDSRMKRKIISAAAGGLFLAAITDLFTGAKVLTEYYQSNYALHRNGAGSVYRALGDSLRYGKTGGGQIGRWISDACVSLFGRIGAGFILFALLFVCLYLFYGIEFMQHLRKRNAYYQEMEQAYEVIQEEEYQKPSYQLKVPKPRRKLYTDRRMQTVDLQQMSKQLDQMEQEQKEKQETKETIQNQHPAMEEIIPDSQAGVPARKQAEEIRSRHREEEKAVAQVSAHPQDEVPVRESAQDVAAEDIPIYREEMQHKFGKKKPDAEGKTAPVPEKGPEPVPSASDMLSEPVPEPKEEPVVPKAKKKAESKKNTPEKTAEAESAGAAEVSASAASDAGKPQQPKRPYQFPPIDLLSVPDQIPGRTSDEELRDTALKLQETLRSFNVNVTMGAVTCGPTVTRYELLPEQGVRVNKITNLADDLKLSMAATSIRIEAPIPGKAAVGIEVPNSTASPVYFRELLEGNAFKKAKSPVTFAVGKDIAGKRIMTDIAKMPHLLIAGATGSGKSVCINTLIMSILYKADPSDVKLIMIDPKVVELSVYNGIPHLFCPVVTDPKEAAASLNWAVREMMERYNQFKELGVRNISGYNQKIKTVENAEQAGYTKMPSLVIIVDEFADLMMVASKEVEDAVCRLAQLARAAGIHLVLATQRPSVNVITGVIKANIPSRIAFSVSSAIDSRTILDKGGAEKLLGKGDMLFFPSGYSEPVRVQGAFISDKEVSDVVQYLVEANEQPEYNHSVTEIIEVPEEQAEIKEDKKKPDHDEYFEEAGRFVIESERAAAGQLQRRFSIGFNRAGRIIDQLHQAGVIGPAEGTKPRKVLMTMAEFEASLHGVETDLPDEEPIEEELTEEILAEEASADMES